MVYTPLSRHYSPLPTKRQSPSTHHWATGQSRLDLQVLLYHTGGYLSIPLLLCYNGPALALSLLSGEEATKAEIISVGTELLLGQLVDTNAAYLAGELPALGIDCYFISQVGDNLNRLTDTLRRAWMRSDLVLVTGGLGPTEDDLTREAIAALLGE
ncbi:MAG: hypothetical protein FJZ89_03455, partial [Chloroflexi bacterium]|nr:hypothetical protein [Chloroflexota bacterium]